MPLTLTLNHAPGTPGGAPESRTLTEGSLTIGRAPGNGWVLADPGRVLSRTHCVVALVEGAWVLTDLSANGVFLNGAAEPLTADRRVLLADGDEIRLGDYVMTVSEAAAPSPTSRPADTLADLYAAPPAAARDAFAHPVAARPVRDDDPFDRADEASPRGRSVDLFKGLDPLADWQGPAQPDNADAPVHAVAAPTPVAAPRFDDLDIDALLGDEPPGPGAAPRGPGPVAVCPPVPAPAVPSTARAAGPADTAGLLAAFLDGAGVAGLRPAADPHTVLHDAGAVLRVMVEGLRDVLMSRAAVKQEFRAEQTMLGTVGNNPLKFSVSAEDAVAALLQPGRPGYQPPLDAAREAFADLKSHELAVLAGVQTALSGLLRRLDPGGLEARAGSGGLLPAARKARCWEQYRTTYQALVRDAEGDFRSVFGQDFARAYDAQARQL
jgi:type VI secretion system protein ImpI/type VI secretion system protein